MHFDLDQQLLIYIRDEREIEKSENVKVIEMSFALLSRRKKLVISVPTDFTANIIGRNMIHTYNRLTPEY